MRYVLMSGVLLTWALCSATSAWACEDWLAKTVAVSGAAEHKSATADWQPLQVEQTICPGDSVRIGANSRAALHLRNNTFMRLDENSVVNFPAPKAATGFWLDLTAGVAHFISRIVNHFEVSTPYVNAVVEGTEFVVSATPAQASVSVLEGKVKTWNDAGTESVTSGQQVQASSRSGALTRINVASATTVEWAIHYPPVLTLQNLHPQDATEQNRLNELTPFLQQNRPDLALQALEQNPQQSPALATARAALLLTVGRADDFDAQIASLLQGPQAGPAHALKAVADAARNRPEQALASAHKAVELEPQQSAGYLALSWAQQSALQLDKALTSAKTAAKLEPQNTLAWLRVSELHLMQGDTGAAQKALSHVKQNSADSAALQAQVLSARGFVNLFRLHIKTARKNFEDALQQDSADPQHHLGLGLALLRDGKLEDGRRQLEYAVSLDPLRSTLRSYLGRAYFEEKRDHEAIKQWELAKQFDPNDPTPYFYTGVHKLFANDPVGAIEELETSKALNDRRAIYRSETLLQSDAASRSATLARAYNEVGYDQGVLLNGWDAIRRDPTNAEGHRLLADHYLGDSRYESARASELLQSQLWQPLSAYPLQPQLSETGIAVVEGSGPQRPGFNEYHSLFTQDGTYGMANGYGGSDGTWGDDLVGSFLAGPMAVSLGQYHFESDGWRENADQEQDIYSGFVQANLSPDTSAQLEYRSLDWEKGDLQPTLGDRDAIDSTEMLRRKTARVGLTHRFTSNSGLALSVIRQDLEYNIDEDIGLGGVPESGESQSLASELQWVYKIGSAQWLVGAGHAEVDASEVFSLMFAEDLGGFLYELLTDQQLQRDVATDDAYIYYQHEFSANFQIALGVDYFDFREDAKIHEVQTEFIDGIETGTTAVETIQDRNDGDNWHPKLGVAWHLSPTLQLRGALFRNVARLEVLGPSLKPTQFMGFSQEYDDLDGQDSRNAALGIDFTEKQLKGGMSVLRRLIDLPVTGVGDYGSTEQAEKILDSYVTYSFNRNLALSLQWLHLARKIDDTGLYFGVVRQSEQDVVPVHLDVFADGPYSFRLTQSYFRQEFDLLGDDARGEESVWVTDISMRYRFPHRLGTASLGVNNMFDEGEEILSASGGTLAFYPGRFFVVAFNLNI